MDCAAGPLGDLGIGGSCGGIRCISAAGGRGQIGAEAGGTVEQPESTAAKASAASGNAGERGMELVLELVCLSTGGEQIICEGVAAGLGGLQPLQLSCLVSRGLPGVVAFNQRDLPVLDDDGSAGADGDADNQGEGHGWA